MPQNNMPNGISEMRRCDVMKDAARKLGFSNWQTFSGHSLRKWFITIMVNDPNVNLREEACTLMEDIELGIKHRKIRRLQQTKDRELLPKVEKKDENQLKQIQEIKRLIQEIKQNEAEEIITRSYNINSHTSYIEGKKG